MAVGCTKRRKKDEKVFISFTVGGNGSLSSGTVSYTHLIIKAAEHGNICDRVPYACQQAAGSLNPVVIDVVDGGASSLLYTSVFLLLSRIGKKYHFDRVSIIEADKAFLSYHFSYQWARHHADLQLGQDF